MRNEREREREREGIYCGNKTVTNSDWQWQEAVIFSSWDLDSELAQLLKWGY
jgi:hypothetical protein